MQARKTRKVIPKACDACRRRKIKCNGIQPCSGCVSVNLTCAYISPRKQGGNKGARATVLEELRVSQEQHTAAHPLTSASGGSTLPMLISPENCINAYIHRVHLVVPILTQHSLEIELQSSNTSLASQQFVLAFCAYIANFGNVVNEAHGDHQAHMGTDVGRHSLEEALRVQDQMRIQLANARSMFISFFLYGAHAGLGNYQQGWFYLREATTLFSMLKVSSIDWYDENTHTRMFWILLISERSHGVRKNRPITLQVTSSSPKLSSAHTLGLRYLASVFQPLDETFFAVWNSSNTTCSKEWLLQLDNDVRTVLPPVLEVSNEEMANLRISQCWLRIKIWELFPRFGFLSTESVFECLTFRYPIAVAMELTVVTMKLPITSLQVHGVGMTEKVFDIACAVVDILSFIDISTSQLELDPIDYLTQVVSLLARLPGGTLKFVPLLLTKVKELRPELVIRLCAAAQVPVSIFKDPMSPDTQFLYEEEVGRGLYADLLRAR